VNRWPGCASRQLEEALVDGVGQLAAAGEDAPAGHARGIDGGLGSEGGERGGHAVSFPHPTRQLDLALMRLATLPTPRWLTVVITPLLLNGLLTAQGRIIAIGDEWLLSDLAFTNQNAQSTQLALNIADYFANNQPGNFLVLSDIPAIPGYGDRGVQGAALAAAMTAAGHTWTINASAPIALPTLGQYDGVFFAGSIGSGSANATVLANYVNAGGSVLVMVGVGGGTNGFPSPGAEAAGWNVFLNMFGLGFGSSYFATIPNSLLNIPIVPGGHDLAQGLTTVSWGNGQLALDLEPGNPLNQVAVRGDFTGSGGPQGIYNDIIATYNLGAVSADYATFASGCAGSAGVPSNTATALPVIGQTMVASIGNLPPPSVAFFMLGFSRTTSAFGPLPIDMTGFGAPGCFGRASNDSVLLLLGSGGSATYSLPLPPSQTLLGMQLFTQALVLSPTTNALGAITSDAAAVTVGN